MSIRGAVTNPKKRANVGVKGQASMQKGNPNGRAQGIRNGERLHLDHEPPLREHERHDPHAVMNPQRIVLLCATCHNTKTAKEQVR